LAHSLVVFSWLAAAQPAPKPADVEGRWTGHLEKPDDVLLLLRRYDVALTIRRDANGFMRATCWAAIWGENEWPVTTLAAADATRVSFQITAPSGRAGRFELVPGDRPDELKGTYTYGDAAYAVSLRRSAEAPASKARKTQIPSAAPGYSAKRVRFNSAGVTLSGIVTLPNGDGPFPAVILAPGSVPELAEPDVPGNPDAAVWMWVIADRLTQAGIATLRTDSRGLGGSKGSFDKATMQDWAGDIRAALSFMRTQNAISPDRVGVLAHSMGTAAAALAVTDSNDFRFFVMLGGVGVPGDQIFLDQAERAWQGLPAVDWTEHHVRMQISAELYRLAKEGLETEEICRELKRRFARLQQAVRPGEDPHIEVAADRFTRPKWRSFLRYDPRPVLRHCRIPVLAVAGASDAEGNAKENLGEIEKSLKEGGNANAKVVELAGLNHALRRTVETDGSNVIDESAMRLVQDWICATVKQ
jgi:hypothetical protein